MQLSLHKKMKFSTKEPADLVTFTEEILNGKLHFLCSVYSPQSIEIDSVSNETIPKIASDLGTSEKNEKRQTKNEKYNSEET